MSWWQRKKARADERLGPVFTAGRYIGPGPGPGPRSTRRGDRGKARPRGLRILDLGTGNAYFPFLCEQLGHRVVAVDLDQFELFRDLVEFLGVDRRTLRILRNEKLPDLDGPFDLVTAFNVCFNEQNTAAMWEAPEWEFFLKDVVRNQLAPGGEIFLKLNPLRKPGGYDEKPLLSWFEAQGAELNVPFVHFPPGVSLYVAG